MEMAETMLIVVDLLDRVRDELEELRREGREGRKELRAMWDEYRKIAQVDGLDARAQGVQLEQVLKLLRDIAGATSCDDLTDSSLSTQDVV